MLLDGLQRLHMGLRVCSPQSIHAHSAPPRGLRLLTAAMMDLERRGEDRVNAIPVRDRPVPDACHSPITRAAGLMPTHGRAVAPELINPTSLTDAALPELNQQLFVPFSCCITVQR